LHFELNYDLVPEADPDSFKKLDPDSDLDSMIRSHSSASVIATSVIVFFRKSVEIELEQKKEELSISR
jgi:hypothetical protein